MRILSTELSCGSRKCCGIMYDPFHLMMMGSFCFGGPFMVYMEKKWLQHIQWMDTNRILDKHYNINQKDKNT